MLLKTASERPRLHLKHWMRLRCKGTSFCRQTKKKSRKKAKKISRNIFPADLKRYRLILFNYQLAGADGSISIDVDKIDSLRQILEGNGGRLYIGFGTVDGLPDKVDETEAVDAFGLDGDTVVSRVGEEFDAVVSLCRMDVQTSNGNILG